MYLARRCLGYYITLHVCRLYRRWWGGRLFVRDAKSALFKHLTLSSLIPQSSPADVSPSTTALPPCSVVPFRFSISQTSFNPLPDDIIENGYWRCPSAPPQLGRSEFYSELATDGRIPTTSGYHGNAEENGGSTRTQELDRRLDHTILVRTTSPHIVFLLLNVLEKHY
jgi:hypothetical protein